MSDNPKIRIPKDDDALLKECEVQTFRSSGSGGQHVNTTDSAVRLIHQPTGIVTQSQQHRSQLSNKLDCLKKLREEVEKRNFRQKRRVPTKKSRRQKAKTMDKKTKHGQKKAMRRKPDY